MAVTPRFFDVLGVAALHGHAFQAESEYGAGNVDELVISHVLWPRMFGGDPAVIGRSVQLLVGRRPICARRSCGRAPRPGPSNSTIHRSSGGLPVASFPCRVQSA
jgi:hypothetical protein